MISVRARIWFFLLKRWRDSIGDISDSKDIRLDDGIGISTNDSWKKEKDISFTEFNIKHLPVLKLDNKKVNRMFLFDIVFLVSFVNPIAR